MDEIDTLNRLMWLKRRIRELDRRIKPHGNAADAATWAAQRDLYKEERRRLLDGERR